MTKELKSVTVRSLRKPGHWWVDNEVLDMFGDDLGCYGIAVYAVLARLCYANSRVTVGQRELAAQARVSQTELARRLKIMIDLGLLVEHKGLTPKSRSSYDLMDVKDLVEQIKAAARERGTAVSSAPPRSRSEEGSATGPQGAPHELHLTNRPISSGDAAQGSQDDLVGIEELGASNLSFGRDTNCTPQVQMGVRASNGVEKTESTPQPGADLHLGGDHLHLGGGNLRQRTARVINRQDPRPKTQDTIPPPAWAKSILARMAPLGVVDAQASKRILEDCREANADVTLDEILFWIGWLAEKAQQPRSGIRDPGAYVIRTVSDCVAGGQYAQLQPGNDRRRAGDEAQARERQAERTATLAWEAYQPAAPALADTTWRAIRGVLEKKVLPQSFETWIKPARGLDAIDGKLYVQVPSPEFQHIGDKYGDLIQEAIEEQGLKVAGVLFVARPEELPWQGGEGGSQ